MDTASHEQFGRIRRLSESHGEWHRVGMAAIHRCDFASLIDAMQAQAVIIREQRRIVAELKDRVRSLSI